MWQEPRDNSKCCQPKPHILICVFSSFNISILFTVIGTGLGPKQKNYFMSPCALEGLNYEEYFNECKGLFGR